MTIGTECDAVNVTGVAAKGLAQPDSALDVPKDYMRIPASGGKHPAVGAKCDR